MAYDRRVEAVVGETVTLFADHYDARARGLPTDFWSCDGESSYEFTAEPVKGERLACLEAQYGSKKIVKYPNATREITFKVEAGTKRLSLVFDVGGTPYDFGRLMQDCGNDPPREICGMTAEYPVATIDVVGVPPAKSPRSGARRTRRKR